MNFKMSASDFEMLAKYISKKAEGSSLKFFLLQESKLTISVTNNLGESVDLIFKSEDLNSFPEIIKAGRLGDEL